MYQLQQYLPFTVLKQDCYHALEYALGSVATVLTVYGIETSLIAVNSYSFLK